ncbi:MAG: beta-ketoacyl synthase chain length factor [Ferruginibacter sp.]
MFYIHQTSCISPQQTFGDVDIKTLQESTEKKLNALEPNYEGIPPGILRRMGKAVRMGVGASLPLLQNNSLPDGIIIGTANGGKGDCVKFLNQVIEYEEGVLTPINFVQSTPNAIGAQISLLTGSKGYNTTHLQQGLAFEYAMIDADMMINEYPQKSYLLGASDDISLHNYYFEDKGDWYKKDNHTNKELYEINSPGSMAGEGAAMFLVNGIALDAIAKLVEVDTFQNDDEGIFKKRLKEFIEKHLPPNETIDLLISGENGDSRLSKYYSTCESLIGEGATVARYKHMCGEYPTATAMALWLCCEIIQKQFIPEHMIKKSGSVSAYKNILIYNNYKGVQNSFMLLSVNK